MKKRSLLKIYARILEWASIVAGLVLVGSCTTVGFKSGVQSGLMMFAVTILIAAVLIGTVFLLTTTSTDVMDLKSDRDARGGDSRRESEPS
jgi:CHASE2 domain-containing sensor protein